MTTEAGLRERKRIATHRAIQAAVLTLSAERCFDNVTVDDISRAANVAPRTFFNYFPSKEAALIGELPSAPDMEQAKRFVAGGPSGNLFADLGELFAVSLDGVVIDRELHAQRHAVFRDDPKLARAHLTWVREMDERIQQLVQQRLRRALPAPTGLAADSTLIANLATAAMRTAWSRWAAGDDSVSLAEQVRTAFADVLNLAGEYR